MWSLLWMVKFEESKLKIPTLAKIARMGRPVSSNGKVAVNYLPEKYVSSHRGTPKSPREMRISAERCGPPSKLEEK